MAASSIELPKIRYHGIRRGEVFWLFDERSLELYSFCEDEARRLEAGLRQGFLNDGDESDPLSQFFLEQEEVQDQPAPSFQSRTRISNIKLALSNRCPSNCDYCFKPKGDYPQPRPGLIHDVLNQALKDFGRESSVFCVSFNLTSEPLVDLAQLSETMEVLEKLRAETGKEFPLYICTSGIVQSPEALEALEKAVADHRLPISIDGSREVHDRHRKDLSGQGTYGRVMKTVEWAKSKNIGLEAQAVLTRDFPHPDLVLEELLDFGFQGISMKPVRAGFSGAFTEADLPTLFESYNRYFQRLESELVKGERRLFKILKQDFALRPLWKMVLRMKTESRCMWGTTHLIVDAMGDYYPCDSVVGDQRFRCGSLEEGIDFESFHQDLSWHQREQCRDCWARSLCGGTCYVNGLALAGDLMAVDPIECALSQYFAEQCIGLMAAMLEVGENPYGLAEVLLN